MKIEELLKKAKIDYEAIKPRGEFIEGSWFLLKEKLDKKEKISFSRIFYFHSRFAFAALILLFFISFFGITAFAQNSLPDEPLYPLKRVTEDMVVKALKNDDIKIENRAKELVELNKQKKSEESIRKAVIEYKEEVLEKKEVLKKEGKNDSKFREKLKMHGEKFKEEIKDEKSKKIINEALEVTEEKGENSKDEKSVQDSQSESQDSRRENNND